MSGTHGDCAPGSGCTDCPTCRGEVRPDAPVMKDMAFAMAMMTGPQATDWFMGPLSVLHTAREAVGRRGQPSAVDKRTLEVLEGAVQSTLQVSTWHPFAASPLPEPPSDEGPGGKPAAPDPDDPAPAPAPRQPAPPVTTRPTKPFPRTRPGVPYVPTEEELQALDRARPPKIAMPGAECCAVLKYPAGKEHIKLSGRLTFPPSTEERVRVSRKFIWWAKYSPNAPCACICCEFVHVVITNKWSFTPLPGVPKEEGTRPERAPHEDSCVFWIKDPLKTPSKWEKESHPRDWRPPAPNLVENVDWFGPFCYGDRDRPTVPSPPGGPEFPPTTRKTLCDEKGNDTPGLNILVGHKFTWEWESWAVIYDKCLGTIEKASFLAWHTEGRIPVLGEPSIDYDKSEYDEGDVTVPEGK